MYIELNVAMEVESEDTRILININCIDVVFPNTDGGSTVCINGSDEYYIVTEKYDDIKQALGFKATLWATLNGGEN